VWIFSRSLVIFLVIAATSVVTFGSGIAFTALAFRDKMAFASFPRISYLMYISLGTAVAADIIIASALCVLLLRSRTGFKTTDSMLTVLMSYAINACVLTTVCAAACFVTYTIWPKEFIFIGIYFCLSKLFFNSLLAMLNQRSSLKKKDDELSDIPVHLTQSAFRPMEFSNTWMSKDGSHQM
jgi:hypothetical protein